MKYCHIFNDRLPCFNIELVSLTLHTIFTKNVTHEKCQKTTPHIVQCPPHILPRIQTIQYTRKNCYFALSARFCVISISIYKNNIYICRWQIEAFLPHSLFVTHVNLGLFGSIHLGFLHVFRSKRNKEYLKEKYLMDVDLFTAFFSHNEANIRPHQASSPKKNKIRLLTKLSKFHGSRVKHSEKYTIWCIRM